MSSAPLSSAGFTAATRGPAGHTLVRRNVNYSRIFRYLSALGRSLAIATVACVVTNPLFRKVENPAAAHPMSNGAPVSVTADIARRLTPETTSPGNLADGALWAGLQ